MLGDARNRVKQGIAGVRLMSGFWFRLADLAVVLAGEMRSKNGREEWLKTDRLPMKIKRLNNTKLLRVLTTNTELGTLPHIPFPLPLLLKGNPAFSAVKVPPGIILAIFFENRVILDIRKLDTALLARKIATLFPMRNRLRVPGRLAHGLELDAIPIDVSTLCIGVQV